MAGIYLHIPYCRQKCNYCNFFSIVSTRTAPATIEAICREIDLKSPLNSRHLIQTVYFGGGTPSLLDKSLLYRLFEKLKQSFQISVNAEITLEANPDDITEENLSFWKSLGVNRLSIGIQSFRNTDLKYLNRLHSAETAINCIHLARQSGFPDLTIDLIYGIPDLSDEQWIENLETFNELSLPHLSAYALTVEPKTPLFHQIKTGKVKPVNEQQSSNQFLILMDFMQAHNYLHYEISNFCKEGHFAKHNLSYWQGTHYIGLGPSAHSYDGSKREWNISSVSEYITSLNKGEVPAESEILTLTDKYNEYVMTGLRTMWGCNPKVISEKFGEKYESYFSTQADKWNHLFINEDDNLILSNQGKLLADRIASDLFYLD